MTTTLSRRRDRLGHTLLAALLVAGLGLAAPGGAAAQGPGAYKAQRFDVHLTPRGPDLDVVETIVFEFQSGTFRKVWRDVPAAKTDGLEIGEARMDGALLPRGDGVGQVAVSGRNRARVQWNFAPVGPSVHTFELRYRARGVTYRDGNADVVRWHALPAEHRYVIDASRIVFVVEDAEVRPPQARRVASLSTSTTPPGVVIDAAGIRSDGWVIGELRYPAGRMIAAMPRWQQAHADAAALGPRWLMGAAALLGLGMMLLLGIRQAYPAATAGQGETTTTSPPAALPAAMAAVLAAKGRTSSHQAIATLLDLADRGVLIVRELPRMLGVRQYEVAQVPGKHELADHEEEVIRMAFSGRGEPVTLSKARGRLGRGGHRFAAAVNADLEAQGLMDPARKSVRDRLTVVSVAMLLASALGCVAAAALIPRFDAWPFLLPLAVLVAGMVGGIMAASTTPLSDAGLIESSRWRGFKRHLKTLADAKDARAMDVAPRWIVYGIAVGLASQWSRYLKAHPAAAPAWFVPAARDDGGAFAAFVGSNAAASGGHGGAGGGAAGGGGSGAG